MHAGTSYHARLVAGSDWVGDGGNARDAIFLQTEGVATGPDGSIYVSDAQNRRVRRITPDGIIQTIAGTGHQGSSGDGGPATSAEFEAPYGIAVDAVGNIYIADIGNFRVRRVTTDGIITTVAGGGLLAPGGLNEGVAATSIMLNAPRNLTVDAAGNLYISDFAGHRVFRRSPGGAIRTYAGTGTAGKAGDGGPAEAAQLAYPAGLAVDAKGNLYIGDTQNHTVRKVDAKGTISTFTTNVTATGLAVSIVGNVLIADVYSGQLLSVTAAGVMSPLSVPTHDVAVSSDGTIYSTDGTLLRRSPANGVGFTVIGGRGDPAHGDYGPATEARLNHPSGVAVDASGNVYIADTDNYRIRQVQTDGTIRTVAGTGVLGNGGDNGPATRASINPPVAIAADAAGSIYFAQNIFPEDTVARTIGGLGNPRVRKFTPGGAMVSNTDVPDPRGLATDAAGNLYVADQTVGKIFRATASGALLNLQGGLVSPHALASAPDGTLYYVDQQADHGRLNHLLRDGSALSFPGPESLLTGVAVDPSGHVFVSADAYPAIFALDASNTLSPLLPDVPLNGLSGITAGPDGVLYVTDAHNGRVWAITSSPNPAPVLAPLQVLNAANLTPGPFARGMLVSLRGFTLQGSDVEVRIEETPTLVLAVKPTEILARVLTDQLIGDTAHFQVWENYAGTRVLRGEATISLQPASPTLFAAADDPAQALASNQDGSLNGPNHAAPVGSILVLYGTGEGLTGQPITVDMGGFGAEVLYAGAVANYPGLLQINARVPSGLDLGNSVSIRIRVGAIASPSGLTIQVAPAR